MVEKENDHPLTVLQNQILQCRLCQDTFGFEPQPVIQGNRRSKIMQIGQAPSKKVHETGRPFNDASGKKLRNEWYCISEEDFYNPDNFYIGSIAHCYPGKNPKGGDRRPPKVCAEQWLRKELELVENEIYILIGGFAAEFFFPGEKLSSLVFEDRIINGKTAYILPHPSPLNMKWFKDYPEFMTDRIFKIRKKVHRVLKV